MQSSLHDADLAKQAQQHVDCVSSSHQDSRHVTLLQLTSDSQTELSKRLWGSCCVSSRPV